MVFKQLFRKFQFNQEKQKEMPTYAYKGRNRLNEMIAGEKEAASQDELRALLRREQIVMTQASEKGRDISIPKLGRKKKVNSKELAVFTRQFSVMIDAGLPLVSCIEILAEQQNNAFFKDVLHQVRQNVEEGATLAASLEKHPKVFDQLYTHMVEAGEAGGVLDLILQRLSTLRDRGAVGRRRPVDRHLFALGVRTAHHRRRRRQRQPAVARIEFRRHLAWAGLGWWAC